MINIIDAVYIYIYFLKVFINSISVVILVDQVKLNKNESFFWQLVEMKYNVLILFQITKIVLWF